MPSSFRRHLLAVTLVLFPLFSCHGQVTSVIAVDHGPEAVQQQQKHYVVMVSLDGFRYDYAKKYGAKHILALGEEGASAPDGMIPAYPSLTFPNHYTLVTGLYPEHHGIVANRFYDPARKATYALGDAQSVTDGSWYSGVPLWSLAEKQGMRTACFFWPGSEAEIAGERPSYYLRFDDTIDEKKRIDQVIAWLRLPDAQRPHFITLYYANVDHAGHEFGPDTPQVAEAVKHVDELIGRLHADLDALHLPIDLIVVSDHGMERVQGSWINLDKYVSLDGFETAGSLLYAPSEAEANRVYQKLKSADASFTVYRRDKVPAYLHYNSNPREGDPVIVPNGPFMIRANAPAAGREDHPPTAGAHGYDPFQMHSMRAIFFAEGPDIKRGIALKPFENINVFPLVTKILGLENPPIDGSANVLSGVLADHEEVKQ
ncbi:alkaline phosphatase D [Silvibacterium bohemicum]|uniref:Alkaline phosphatase D n=1 Tax=Silvibacterium bohemicum TaxID=1577686 RepID=A0A841JU45_9BACT|nr:ectonucleotide pyrophosphatase/phosphodiesterase [Silvibacterium bohemicum]MBB6142501.1 alkaline phosphatase D [Silvibacterium bohemicum]